MFENQTVVDMINRSAENEADRRNFLRTAGLADLGLVGATTLAAAGGLPASAAPTAAAAGAPSDGAILIVYLNPAQVSRGGFFPPGLNGELKTSADNA